MLLPYDRNPLQAAEKVHDQLLIGGTEAIEGQDHAICFRTIAGMLLDGSDDVGSAPVVEEKCALADTPERRRAEHVARGVALLNAVREIFAHVMEREVRERLVIDVGHATVG